MSVNNPSLFISHATRRKNFNARTKEIRQEITRLLQAQGWTVFVDEERLEAGDRWRPEILHNLSNARAGVILFDETAVKESDWVKAEALIMCFRQAIDPDFQLIPVFLKPYQLKDEAFNIYRPFQLDEISYVEDDDSRDIPAKIIAPLKIEKAQTNLSENIWITKFELMLKSLLKAEKLGIDTLYESWNMLIRKAEIETPGVPVFKEQELVRAIIQLMHHLEFSKVLESYKTIKTKSVISPDDLTMISQFIKVKWVENDWVEIFFRSSRKFKDKLLLVCSTPNAIIDLSKHIECFLARLEYEKKDIKTFTVGGNPGETEAAIERYIEEEIKTRLESPFPIETVYHADYVNAYGECVVYIPKLLVRTAVLAKLKKRYSNIVFLIEMENPKQNKTFTDSKTGAGDLRMELLEPSLTIEKISEFSRETSKL